MGTGEVSKVEYTLVTSVVTTARCASSCTTRRYHIRHKRLWARSRRQYHCRRVGIADGLRHRIKASYVRTSLSSIGLHIVFSMPARNEENTHLDEALLRPFLWAAGSLQQHRLSCTSPVTQ